MLRRLHCLGFTELTGVDPFVVAPTAENGMRILKQDLLELDDEKFDVIILSHSLEHMDNPIETLTAARNLLRDNGKIVVQIPIVSFAWKRFGTKWVQLDAPRHTSVFTYCGMTRATSSSGLRILKFRYDSTAFQFWGSKAYLRGEYLSSSIVVPFSFHWIIEKIRFLPYATFAWLLNRVKQGDQATFVLVDANSNDAR